MDLSIEDQSFDLSIQEAAEIVGAHVDTVRRWAMKGHVRGFRTPGGRWRFRRADLDAFVAAGVNKPAEVPA